jgi:hypothetical protein
MIARSPSLIVLLIALAFLGQANLVSPGAASPPGGMACSLRAGSQEENAASSVVGTLENPRPYLPTPGVDSEGLPSAEVGLDDLCKEPPEGHQAQFSNGLLASHPASSRLALPPEQFPGKFPPLYILQNAYLR